MSVQRSDGKSVCWLALVAILLLAANAPLFGQQGTEPVAPSPAAKVDSLFAPWDRTDSPGCAVAVFRNSQVVHARGYGMASLEHGIAITPQSVFDIGSTSKQFTAMSIVLLAEDGKLSLDDDVRRFVPELPDYGRRITIRHLLTHTSGLRDYLTLWWLAGSDDADYTTSAEALSLITRQRSLNFEPGAQYLYSNSGYFLLSVIVERASGKSLAAYAHERIFAPLGMRHTRFLDDHTAIVANRATGYMPQAGGGFAVNMSNYEQTGDGAVQTSVEDLLRWDENFYTGQVGGRKALEVMQTPAVLTDGRPLSYALGLSVGSYRGLRTVSHGGAWAGYRAELLRFPDQHLSVACLCNLSSTGPTRLAYRVADFYLANAFTEPGETPREGRAAATVATVGADARASERHAGVYRDPRTGSVLRFRVRGDTLYRYASDLSSSEPLAAISADHFRYRDGRDVVFRGGAGRQAARVSVAAGTDTVNGERMAEASPTPVTLAGYAGVYDGDEIGATYTLAIEGGQLVLHRRRAKPVALVPTYADAFAAGPLLFTFERRGGRVTGMVIDAGRTRGLRFAKRPR